MKKRGFGAGKWNGAGGKLDHGETIEQALVRECQEEITVTPKHYWPVAELDFVQDEGAEPWRMYVHAYMCDEWEGEPAETEEMAPKWYDAETLPYADMWEDDPHWIPQVVRGEKLYGKFIFDTNNTLVSHEVHTVDSLPISA